MAPTRPTRALAALFFAGGLAGCATKGTFPSLLPRAVEQLSFEEPVKVDPPVAPSPALATRGNALLAEARRGDSEFAGAVAEARRRAGAAGAVGSDGWVQLQEAISRAEAARTTTSNALADLDRLVTDESVNPVNDETWRQVLAARAATQAISDAQTQRLRSLGR